MPSAARTFEVAPISRLFKALGDETRLRIVALLSHGELCVCHVQEALKISQPNVSRHLSILRAARVVESRREGTWVYYRLIPQASAECKRQMRALSASFAAGPALRRDLERLVKARGPRACS